MLLHFYLKVEFLDEWLSSTSSDNSKKASGRRFSHNYPTITLDDDDDDIVEIKDTNVKRRPLHHSTPAYNGTKRNGNTSSAYFSYGNTTNLGAIPKPGKQTFFYFNLATSGQ